jgi:hypothetical protein
MVMIPAGATAPSGYQFIGRFNLTPSSGPRGTVLVVDVYRKQ